MASIANMSASPPTFRATGSVDAIVNGVTGTLVASRKEPTLDGLKLKGDEQFGANIIEKALEAPLRQIAQNAGEGGEVARRARVGAGAARARSGGI